MPLVGHLHGQALHLEPVLRVEELHLPDGLKVDLGRDAHLLCFGHARVVQCILAARLEVALESQSSLALVEPATLAQPHGSLRWIQSALH